MITKIENLKKEIEALSASNAEEVEALRIKYLSKKGEVTSLFNDFRTVPAEQKREVGKLLNELKEFATEKINALKEEVLSNVKEDDTIDLTRSAYVLKRGTRHPLSIVKNEKFFL